MKKYTSISTKLIEQSLIICAICAILSLISVPLINYDHTIFQPLFAFLHFMTLISGSCAIIDAIQFSLISFGNDLAHLLKNTL